MYSKVTGASDLDWSEIAEMFHSGMHPDQLRKMGAGIKLASDAECCACIRIRQPPKEQTCSSFGIFATRSTRRGARSRAARRCGTKLSGRRKACRIFKLSLKQGAAARKSVRSSCAWRTVITVRSGRSAGCAKRCSTPTARRFLKRGWPICLGRYALYWTGSS